MGWLIVFYDLPFSSKNERRCYTQFRKLLLEDGYHMVQRSVYARPCVTPERVETHARRLEGYLPAAGSIRCLYVTNKQWESMMIFEGMETQEPSEQDQMPKQLMLW